MPENIELNGLTFRVDIECDEDMRPPWEENDGHGVVTEWTRREKKPSERILSSDRGVFRYYDFAASVGLSKAGGWGVPDPFGKSKGQIANEAAELDFKRLKDWCEARWWYVYVVVTLLTTNGEDTLQRASLGGIESDSDKYLQEIAVELASEIAAEVGDTEVLRMVKEYKIR
jgi:hypothetical protein